MRFCGGLTPLKKSENGNSTFVDLREQMHVNCFRFEARKFERFYANNGVSLDVWSRVETLLFEN